jgi:hypothetical protein
MPNSIMAKKRILLMAVALTLVCACTGQGVLPPMPGDALEVGAEMVITGSDQQTGDVSLQYTILVKNVSDQTLEKVILRDFQLPSDIVMQQNYFEIENLRAGETRQVTFGIVVLGWGITAQRQQWEVDYTMRIEEGSAYTEQTFYYGIELYPE